MREVVGPVRQQHEHGRAPDRARRASRGRRARRRSAATATAAAGTRRAAASCSTTASSPPPSPAHAGADDERERLRAPDVQAAQRRGDLVVAHRAERRARRRCGSGCSSTNSTTSAPAHAIHASQRSSGKFAPRHDGGVGGLIDQPVLAAERARELVGERRQPDRERERRAGQVRAAQPARRGADGDRRRAAVTTTDATSAGTSAQCSLPISSATVYAPTAISAPWPSEIWPLSPVSTVSPASAAK